MQLVNIIQNNIQFQIKLIFQITIMLMMDANQRALPQMTWPDHSSQETPTMLSYDAAQQMLLNVRP